MDNYRVFIAVPGTTTLLYGKLASAGISYGEGTVKQKYLFEDGVGFFV